MYKGANINSLTAGDDATSFVLTHIFTHFDLEVITNNHPAYINFTRHHLLQKIPTLLPKDKIVIEVLEDIIIDEPLLERLRALKQQGYQLALDDFIFRRELTPLVELADIIKVDILQLNQQEIKKQLQLIGTFKGQLLAEKIENHAQFALCKDLGFNLFQGFFLSHPYLVHGHRLSENKNLLLKLIAELHDPEVTLLKIEEIILQMPKLSYRILKLAKSAAFYSGGQINSIKDAILQLGLIQIRNWTTLLLASSTDEVASHLLERTLVRAKMCQELATASQQTSLHEGYTVGMFSMLDAIFQEPMPTLLEKIPLSEELKDALISRSGELGCLLTLISHYEQGNFHQLKHPALTAQDYSQAYIQGLEYAAKIMKSLS